MEDKYHVYAEIINGKEIRVTYSDALVDRNTAEEIIGVIMREEAWINDPPNYYPYHAIVSLYYRKAESEEE